MKYETMTPRNKTFMKYETTTPRNKSFMKYETMTPKNQTSIVISRVSRFHPVYSSYEKQLDKGMIQKVAFHIISSAQPSWLTRFIDASNALRNETAYQVLCQIYIQRLGDPVERTDPWWFDWRPRTGRSAELGVVSQETVDRVSPGNGSLMPLGERISRELEVVEPLLEDTAGSLKGGGDLLAVSEKSTKRLKPYRVTSGAHLTAAITGLSARFESTSELRCICLCFQADEACGLQAGAWVRERGRHRRHWGWQATINQKETDNEIK